MTVPSVLRSRWAALAALPILTAVVLLLTQTRGLPWSSAGGHRATPSSAGDPLISPPGKRPATRSSASDPVIAAAGDIACGRVNIARAKKRPGGRLALPSADAGAKAAAATPHVCGEEETADLLEQLRPSTVLPLGDTQYECGEAANFATSYDPTWGKLKSISRPVIGNHEYGHSCHVDNPSAYFAYFGSAAGPGRKGWYSYDVGSWHLIALNSECTSGRGSYKVGGCGQDSPQETWLRQDLSAHPNQCTLAYWHEPRFSSGEHGDSQRMADLWNDLVRAHVDVVLSGHNHDYERFDPVGVTARDPAYDPSNKTAPPNFQSPRLAGEGIREFVVGTGGKNHYSFGVPPLPGEKVRNSTTFGVLAMTLHPDSYDWRFVPSTGSTFSDSGTASCN